MDETNAVLRFLGDGDKGQFDAVMIVSVRDVMVCFLWFFEWVF